MLTILFKIILLNKIKVKKLTLSNAFSIQEYYLTIRVIKLLE